MSREVFGERKKENVERRVKQINGRTIKEKRGFEIIMNENNDVSFGEKGKPGSENDGFLGKKRDKD